MTSKRFEEVLHCQLSPAKNGVKVSDGELQFHTAGTTSSEDEGPAEKPAPIFCTACCMMMSVLKSGHYSLHPELLTPPLGNTGNALLLLNTEKLKTCRHVLGCDCMHAALEHQSPALSEML